MATPQLTEQELHILELSAAGYTYEHIGSELGLRRPTVGKSVSRMLRKFGARSMPQAVLLACQAGILDGRPQRHGDHAGYAAHKYRGETPCQACVDGERAYRTAYRRARKLRQGAAA